jgi:hypothetical protein
LSFKGSAVNVKVTDVHVWPRVHVQFCPLGSKDDPCKPDVNTQMLLAETLGAVAALARPKLPKDRIAAIRARPHQMDLSTDVKADPCSDLSELRRDEQQTVLAAVQAAAEDVRAAEGQGGPEALAAARGVLADAQAQVQAVVLDPRKRRRQLYQQVSWARVVCCAGSGGLMFVPVLLVVWLWRTAWHAQAHTDCMFSLLDPAPPAQSRCPILPATAFYTTYSVSASLSYGTGCQLAAGHAEAHPG